MYILLFFLYVLRPVCLPLPEAALLLFGMSFYSETFIFFLSLAGTVVGIGCMRLLSERCCGWLVRKLKCQEKLDSFCRFVKIGKYKMIGILFIVPVFPDILISMGAAVLKVELPKYLAIAAIAKAVSIGMIVYANELAKICSLRQWQVIVLELLILQVLSWLTKKLIKVKTA